MKNVHTNSESQQPRPIYYEPTHTPWDETSIRVAFEARGYRLVRGEDPTGTAAAVLMQDGTVIAEGAGLPSMALTPMDDYPSAGAYATSIVNFFEFGSQTTPDERDPHEHLTSAIDSQADDLHYFVGAWADRDTTDGMYRPGVRNEAMRLVDLMLAELQELRSQLVREGRAHQDELMARVDAIRTGGESL